MNRTDEAREPSSAHLSREGGNARWRALTIRTVLLALIPPALLFAPAVRTPIVSGAVQWLLPPEGRTSYSPDAPLLPYAISEHEAFLMAVGILAASVVVSALLSLGSVALSRADGATKARAVKVAVILSAGLSVILVLGPVARAITAVPEAGSAAETRNAETAQWAEERYGVSIDSDTASALLETAQPTSDTDSVTVDGHTVILTPTQGGYLLTEDAPATELPRR